MLTSSRIEARNTLQLGVMLDDFVQSITSKTPLLCPGEMGPRDIRITEAIYASAKQGSSKVKVNQ